MAAAVAVHHRPAGIVAHAAGAEDMGGTEGVVTAELLEDITDPAGLEDLPAGSFNEGHAAAFALVEVAVDAR